MKTRAGTTPRTDISDRLHQKALAWFQAHPKHKAFVRSYEAGELAPDMKAKAERDLGGPIRYCYIQLMTPPLTVRVPLTQEMYDEMHFHTLPFIEEM